MNRIRVLDEHTANKIAAGEVVERPASIVKELVENSLDAGSTAITIETRGGGMEYIRVTDNGIGIPEADVPMAFERHATSKISDESDLNAIETLGFRGEALASVAAVSRVAMRTRTADAEAGSLLRIEGGNILNCDPTGCPPGTTIEVSDLFFNVPARLKFIKSQRSEAAAISDYASRLILAKPHVSFRLIQSGKTVYHSAGDGELLNAVYTVYGTDALPHLRTLDYDDGYIKIFGCIGTEQLARPNRLSQSFFVNGRYIRSQKLSYAMQRAFDTRLMSGRFPFIVAHVEIACDEVDVNVHPNKLEVRFTDEERVTRAALMAARKALGDPVAPEISAPEAGEKYSRITRPPERRDERIPEHTNPFAMRPVSVAVHKIGEATGSVPAPRPAMPPITQNTEQGPAEIKIVSAMARKEAAAALMSGAKGELQLDFGVEPYKLIGCLFDCYWVVQQGQSVFFIDQHAAHERRLYERMMQKGLRTESQLLLMPLMIKLTAHEYERLLENRDVFAELGFDFSDYGANTVSVNAVPYIFEGPETGAFLREALSELEKKGAVSAEELKRGSIIKAACKHAVKAGQGLKKEEIESLLAEFTEKGSPMTCPHGRPVMTRMTKTEFEKLFKRIV